MPVWQINVDSATKPRVSVGAASVHKRRCERQRRTLFLSPLLRPGGVLVLSLLLALSFTTSLRGQTSVTLAWDESATNGIAGYKVYYGTSSHQYTNSVQTGPDFSCTISGLQEGTTYFFAVTAFDSSGTESAFSDEISYTVPVVEPEVQAEIMPDGQVVFDVTGWVGITYDVLGSPDQQQWTALGTQTVGPAGSFELVEPPGTLDTYPFYRLSEVVLARINPVLQISLIPDQKVLLSGTGQVGHAYDVLAAEDLVTSTWKALGTVFPDNSGGLTFTDPSPATHAFRFYRVHDVTYASPLPTLQIGQLPDGRMLLTGTGGVGHTYDILATQDFITWFAIGGFTIGTTGAFEFADPDASEYPCRFYRVQEVEN